MPGHRQSNGESPALIGCTGPIYKTSSSYVLSTTKPYGSPVQWTESVSAMVCIFNVARPFFSNSVPLQSPVLDRFNRHFQAPVHFPLSNTANTSQQH
jgi:hypothetical protein